MVDLDDRPRGSSPPLATAMTGAVITPRTRFEKGLRLRSPFRFHLRRSGSPLGRVRHQQPLECRPNLPASLACGHSPPTAGEGEGRWNCGSHVACRIARGLIERLQRTAWQEFWLPVRGLIPDPPGSRLVNQKPYRDWARVAEID